MNKKQFKILIQKLSKEIFIKLKLVEEIDPLNCESCYLMYKPFHEDCIITISSINGIINVKGEIGCATMRQIVALEDSIRKALRGF